MSGKGLRLTGEFGKFYAHDGWILVLRIGFFHKNAQSACSGWQYEWVLAIASNTDATCSNDVWQSAVRFGGRKQLKASLCQERWLENSSQWIAESYSLARKSRAPDRSQHALLRQGSSLYTVWLKQSTAGIVVTGWVRALCLCDSSRTRPVSSPAHAVQALSHRLVGT